MRVASLLILDVIEKLNQFGDEPDKKKSVLVFLPGLYEIFEFMDFINEWYGEDNVKRNLEMIPLHSSLCEYIF